MSESTVTLTQDTKEWVCYLFPKTGEEREGFVLSERIAAGEREGGLPEAAPVRGRG